jgi:hypothetical protein
LRFDLTLQQTSEFPGSGKFTGIREKIAASKLIFNNLQMEPGLLFYVGNADRTRQECSIH